LLYEPFIEIMEDNEDIFSRVMTDKKSCSAAHEHLAKEIFDRVRGQNQEGN
jgi:type I restriction enzyme R subunit